MSKKNQTKAIMQSFRVSFMQCMTRCGKKGCRCETGLQHGPYWYARFTALSGKRRTVYLGSQLPKEFARIKKVAQDESWLAPGE